MIYVSLISYTPDPERTNAAAIRISTSPVSATAITMKTMAETTFQPLNIYNWPEISGSTIPASPLTSMVEAE